MKVLTALSNCISYFFEMLFTENKDYWKTEAHKQRVARRNRAIDAAVLPHF